MNRTIKEAAEDNDIWEGMQTIGRDYKPTRHAQRDRRGNIVEIDRRADAAKEYLEVDHWGKKEIIEPAQEKTDSAYQNNY